jgi:solute carrier family 34 (sodium-dependent phosphate cotransporter)
MLLAGGRGGPVKVLSGASTSHASNALLLVGMSAAGLVISFGISVRVLSQLTALRAKGYLQRALDAGILSGVLVGAVCAFLLQSGRRATSVLVPMAGAGVVSAHQVLPIALGANVGMTFTGLVAGLAATGPGAAVAVQAALIHVLFNALCVATICPWAPLRRVPIGWAELLADRAVHSKKAAFLAVLVVFYALPAGLAAVLH